MQGYNFADEVYHCFADSHCVMLDLKGDRYITATRHEADRVIQVLHEYAGHRDIVASDAVADDSESARLLSEWLQKGLLIETWRGEAIAEPVSIPPPNDSIQAAERLPVRMLLRFLPSFALSARQANSSLTHEPLARTVRDVARRMASVRERNQAFDRARAELVVAAFAALRPLFPRNYLCLFDSLALLNLSLRRGLAPRWVFGVQAEPFCAHCWLQQDDVVLYDSVDRVSAYTPIMAV